MSEELTLEKLKISEKLGDIDTTLKLTNQELGNMTKVVEAHNRELYGNGSYPGMKTTLDRVHQWRNGVGWVIGLLTVMVLSVAGRLFYELVTKVHEVPMQ